MDKVQVYVVVLIVLTLLSAFTKAFKCETTAQHCYHWGQVLGGLGLSLPIYGRIFGWW
jgi:hypothetical protein